MRQARRLEEEALYQAAVGALARRDRSQAEMRRWLEARAASAAARDGVLARLREHGYLNDERLAEAYTALQKEVEHHGRQRAVRGLRARGIAAEVAERAARHGYAGANEAALLRAHIRKKRQQRPETQRQAANLYRRWLLAGFPPAVCQQALRAWKLDAEWVADLETIELPDEDDQSVGP